MVKPPGTLTERQEAIIKKLEIRGRLPGQTEIPAHPLPPLPPLAYRKPPSPTPMEESISSSSSLSETSKSVSLSTTSTSIAPISITSTPLSTSTLAPPGETEDIFSSIFEEPSNSQSVSASSSSSSSADTSSSIESITVPIPSLSSRDPVSFVFTPSQNKTSTSHDSTAMVDTVPLAPSSLALDENAVALSYASYSFDPTSAIGATMGSYPLYYPVIVPVPVPKTMYN